MNAMNINIFYDNLGLGMNTMRLSHAQIESESKSKSQVKTLCDDFVY
jgi:hypothetical protein